MQQSTPQNAAHGHGDIPPTLTSPAAVAFWSAIVLTGRGAGVLTGIGQLVLQRLSSANGIDISEAIARYGDRLPTARTLDTRSIYDVRSENPRPG